MSQKELEILPLAAPGRWDSNRDLIWTRSGTENAVWYMNGRQYVGSAQLSAAGWRIVSTGDFNNDGNPDTVLRHDGTGQNAIWLMDGTTILSGHPFPRVSDMSWRIGGTKQKEKS